MAEGADDRVEVIVEGESLEEETGRDRQLRKEAERDKQEAKILAKAKKIKAKKEAAETLRKDRADETVLRTAGQRRINLLWETTQAVIALAVVLGGLGIMANNAFQGNPDMEIPSTLSSMIFLVLGFYFARTNHSNMGGVGPNYADNQRR